MSKIKMTFPELKKLGITKFYYCGYCDLQALKGGRDAIYYNCGVYGWNCDIFIDWTTRSCISTGYRNMHGKRINSRMIDAVKSIDELFEALENPQILEPAETIVSVKFLLPTIA